VRDPSELTCAPPLQAGTWNTVFLGGVPHCEVWVGQDDTEARVAEKLVAALEGVASEWIRPASGP